MQHNAKRHFGLSKPASQSIGALKGAAGGVGGMILGVLLSSTVYADEIKNKTCINYYTVGDTDCTPAASTAVQPTQTVTAPRLLKPQETKSPVDEYLENYGKPPREFVEFYLNPTTENAQKWVAEYRKMLSKSSELSKAWNDADQLYQQQNPSALPPSPLPAQAPALQPQAQPEPVSLPQPKPRLPERLGAYTNQPQGGSNPSNGVRQNQVAVTYYFSQTCPYCARMTPDLAAISSEMSGKLALTCVDVTPLGAQNRPNEAYITSKLPCQWRLPVQGEVVAKQVNQTPTLWIEKEGQTPLRLSGYVPLAQLRSYLY